MSDEPLLFSSPKPALEALDPNVPEQLFLLPLTEPSLQMKVVPWQ